MRSSYVDYLIDIWSIYNIFVFKSGDYLREKYSDAAKVKPTKKGRLRLHKSNAKETILNKNLFSIFKGTVIVNLSYPPLTFYNNILKSKF